MAGLCCALLIGCSTNDLSEMVAVADDLSREEAYAELLEQTPVVEIEGEILSPDGAYKVVTSGTGEQYVSGVRLPDSLQVVDTEHGTVLWKDTGYLWQSARWSPDGRYLALAYAGRTWNQVLLLETETWTTWQFVLPDGAAIPEYTFLPHEDWGEWINENTIQLIVGQGGDGGEQRTYQCFVGMSDGQLTGYTQEQTTKILSKDYDFDHDGKKETLILKGNTDPIEESSFWGINVVQEGGQTIWFNTAATSRAGWNSLFALEIDGEDYLLRYNPYMGQGFATYSYQIFSLNGMGEELLIKENDVEFDINFGSPHHSGFDPVAIAAFLEEVHGYLDGSTLLISTESGVFRSCESGADFREAGFFWDEFCLYDDTLTMEQNVRNFQQALMVAQGVT